MTHACNPSYSGGWSKIIAWTWEAEVAVSQDRTIVLQAGQQEWHRLKGKKKKKFVVVVVVGDQSLIICYSNQSLENYFGIYENWTQANYDPAIPLPDTQPIEKFTYVHERI